MKKLFCAALILCLFFIVRAANEGERLFEMEDECSRSGGHCIDRVSCPPEKVSRSGHCPKQKDLGAVCCHGLSIHETECQKLGGHCVNSCPEKLVITQARDCKENKCCPLTV